MAWCRSNRSAAHAIGVFIPDEVQTMTTKATNDHAPPGGTMSAGRDADRRVRAGRAQTELIDILARLVLASVEAESAAKPTQRPRDDTGVRRSRKSEA